MKRAGWSPLASYGLVAVLLLSLCRGAIAAEPQDVLDIDLSPLIDQSARYPTRFAVDVPRAVSTADAGTWTENGTSSIWTYSIRIPTAADKRESQSHSHRDDNKGSRPNPAVRHHSRSQSRRAGLWRFPLLEALSKRRVDLGGDAAFC